MCSLTTQAARKAESSVDPESIPSADETIDDSEPTAGELEECAAADQTPGDATCDMTGASTGEQEDYGPSISELELNGDECDSEVYLPADRNSYSPSSSESEESLGPPASVIEDDEVQGSPHKEVQVVTPGKSQTDADATHPACPRFTALEHGIVTCIVAHKDTRPTDPGASVSEIVHFLATEGIPFSAYELA